MLGPDCARNLEVLACAKTRLVFWGGYENTMCGLYKTKLINTKWPTSSYMYSMKGMLIAGHLVQELHLHVTSAILYEAKQTGVDLFCFIADSLTFRCGFCHRHVVFAQAEQQNTKKTRAYLLPTRKRQSKKSTQWQGLGPARGHGNHLQGIKRDDVSHNVLEAWSSRWHS